MMSDKRVTKGFIALPIYCFSVNEVSICRVEQFNFTSTVPFVILPFLFYRKKINIRV